MRNCIGFLKFFTAYLLVAQSSWQLFSLLLRWGTIYFYNTYMIIVCIKNLRLPRFQIRFRFAFCSSRCRCRCRSCCCCCFCCRCRCQNVVVVVACIYLLFKVLSASAAAKSESLHVAGQNGLAAKTPKD